MASMASGQLRHMCLIRAFVPVVVLIDARDHLIEVADLSESEAEELADLLIEHLERLELLTRVDPSRSNEAL